MKRFAWALVLSLGCGDGGDEAATENTAVDCSDLQDNDDDGAIDCDDTDCDATAACDAAESEAEAEGECEGSDPACQFTLPDDDVIANDGDDDADEEELQAKGQLVDADYSCLGNNVPPAPPTGTITITGVVEDFQSESPVEEAEIEVFARSDDFSQPLTDVVISDADGIYTITFDGADLAKATGEARVSWRVTAGDQLATLHLNQFLECDEQPEDCEFSETRTSVSEVTAATLPAILGTQMPDGSSAVVGDIVDCQRRSVANANGRVYTTAGALVEGVEVYYFEQAFPVRRSLQTASSPDGLFLMPNVFPGGTVELRAYGNIDGVETLLSAVRLQPEADAVVITDMDPLAE